LDIEYTQKSQLVLLLVLNKKADLSINFGITIEAVHDIRAGRSWVDDQAPQSPQRQA
jgi:hypothetical protein